VVAALCVLWGCAGPRSARLAPEVVQALAASQASFVDGEVGAVHRSVVLEDRDFAYAAAFSPDGTRVAWVHLGGDGFRLATAALEGDEKTRDVLLGPVDFDVEGLAFTPDGAHLVTASRDGLVRRLASTGAGAVDALAPAEAPLTSVAIHPSGRFLGAGDTTGTVHFFSLPDLLPMGELAAHRDEIHGLAFTPGGTLISGSWDRTLAVHEVRLARAPVTTARLRPLRHEGQVFLRAAFNGRAQVPLTLDARAPFVALTRSAAAQSGIEVHAIGESVDVPTATGLQRAPLARAVSVRFRELVLELDVAICDACVPSGAQGVLGGPFESLVAVRFEPDGAAVLTLRSTAEAASRRSGAELAAGDPVRGGAGEGRPLQGQAADPGPEGGAATAREADLVLATERARHDVGAHVNAISLDARGARVALALSEGKAVRTREVYQREKSGVVEPAAAGNAAVVLDLEGFVELARQGGHRGVVSAVALSPDGRTLASGGWDRRVLVRPVASDADVGAWTGGWSIRELRFSRDGRNLVAAAWTPIVATGSGRSAPSVQVFSLDYVSPRVATAADQAQ